MFSPESHMNNQFGSMHFDQLDSGSPAPNKNPFSGISRGMRHQMSKGGIQKPNMPGLSPDKGALFANKGGQAKTLFGSMVQSPSIKL